MCMQYFYMQALPKRQYPKHESRFAPIPNPFLFNTHYLNLVLDASGIHPYM